MSILHEVYNALPGIERANGAIRQEREFNVVMSELGKVVLDHRLEDIIGIRLLHRHNDLRPGDLMVEDLEQVDGAAALVTARYANSEVQFDFMPSMWACRGAEGRQDLEFSRQSLLPIDRYFLKSNRDFFVGFAEKARALDVEDFLGVCVLDRDGFPVNKESQTEVESTDVVRPANVIRVRSKDLVRTENYFETTWQVHRESSTSCPTTCCSYCTPRSPGHEISHHTVHPTPD
ncbi:hypothetical protein IVB03_14040 [Bradyrhizobium sp. 168]|uniref:hypothetical protein n=1 Tax=Bradyrhizobium sp. 168 TaxID=2782639 RepID=UPI001FFABAE1|nr:hypothetical protein [Bradyrhizobium sp. 168]MCK1580672.1 hypothetical protein [Bradyrhizobium sp. 168]